MVTEWHRPGPEDRAWSMYSANYLFRTANVHWAIDPLRLKRRLPSAPEMPAGDLKGLNFILLTHQHGDHLDLSLLRQLIDFPILWIIPAPVLEQIRAEAEIPTGRLIVPEPMRRIEIQGIGITPFEGLHWEKQAGTESLGAPRRRDICLSSTANAGYFPETRAATMPACCNRLARLRAILLISDWAGLAPTWKFHFDPILL